MKICDITQFYSSRSGGVRRYLNEKRAYVKNHTQDEHLLIIPGEKMDYQKEGRLHLVTIASPIVSKISRYRILLNTKKVSQILREHRPDIIECSDPYQLAWTCIKMGKELKIPVLGFYHSHFSHTYLQGIKKYCGAWIYKKTMHCAKRYVVSLYSKFDRTLVPSSSLCQVLKDWGVPRTRVASLGIDTESFTPLPSPPTSDNLVSQSQWRKDLGIPSNSSGLLYVGRLAKDKNVETLLNTFDLLEKNQPHTWTLIIIGDGPLRKKLLQKKKNGASIVWLPYIEKSKDLAVYYQNATIFVHPGIYETFGLVTLEAQACGCPVIGIKGSHMDNNALSGFNYWAEKNTPQALQQAIQAISQDNLKELGCTAAKKAKENFSWNHVFDQLWKHYNF